MLLGEPDHQDCVQRKLLGRVEGVVRGGGIWKEVDAREPWADGTVGGQTVLLCEGYFLQEVFLGNILLTWSRHARG